MILILKVQDFENFGAFTHAFVSYKLKYVHKVLVNCLVKLARKKVWLGELTVPT